MGEDLDYIINTNKIEVRHLRILKIKQSVEAIFFVIFFFTIMTTLGDKLVEDSQKQISEIQKNVNEGAKTAGPYDTSVKLTDLKNVQTTKVVKVKKGENIYIIFKAEGIPYSDENLADVKLMNPKIKSLKRLSIGDELILPIKQGGKDTIQNKNDTQKSEDKKENNKSKKRKKKKS